MTKEINGKIYELTETPEFEGSCSACAFGGPIPRGCKTEWRDCMANLEIPTHWKEVCNDSK